MHKDLFKMAIIDFWEDVMSKLYTNQYAILNIRFEAVGPYFGKGVEKVRYPYIKLIPDANDKKNKDYIKVKYHDNHFMDDLSIRRKKDLLRYVNKIFKSKYQGKVGLDQVWNIFIEYKIVDWSKPAYICNPKCIRWSDCHCGKLVRFAKKGIYDHKTPGVLHKRYFSTTSVRYVGKSDDKKEIKLQGIITNNKEETLWIIINVLVFFCYYKI